MKRLLFSFVSLLCTSGFAQNAQPKYITEEIVVTDTAKAMELAEQRRNVLKEEMEEDRANMRDRTVFLAMINHSKKKKIKL